MTPPLRLAWIVRLWPVLLCLAPAAATAQDPRETTAAITRQLQEFLARNDDPAEHARFWADDLVYTSSKGEVTNKAEIMKSFAAAPAAAPSSPQDAYGAEDIVVRPYGTTAILTFRLVRHAPDGSVHYYRNSGTLLLRGGQWQVVCWQATQIPDAAKKP